MKINVLEYLERTTKKFPDKVAVIDENESITYSQLLESSKKIGTALSKIITPGQPVAVFAEKSVKTLCVFFGIIQAGGFYVLINPDLPEYRITQVQSVLQAKYFVVTDPEKAPAAASFVGEENVLYANTLLDTKPSRSTLKAIRQQMTDTSPLYANFTSGSTGVPKGVLVSHRSVVDFIDVFTKEFGINDTDIIGNQAPFDFDVSVKDIYSAVKTGATLVVIPKRLFSAPTALLDFICDHKITTMTWAVSAICLISTLHGLDYKTPHTVKRILFSGEEMPLKHLKDWQAHLPNTEFVNLYGPTEITCNCTFHRVDPNKDYSTGIPIGRAFRNESVFLLDDNNQKIDECEKVGEICVKGTALALGYYRNHEQTAKAFCQNPLNDCYPERIYRTGDLAYISNEGEFVFSGRKDFQIKHMGHRIEIEEIERHLASVDGVERACVIFDKEKSRLYGFYIGTIDKKELHTKMREFLPVYMIPNTLVNTEEFPLTKNGKIDRPALLATKKKR